MMRGSGNRRPVAGWVWGILLVLVGGIFLAINMGLISIESIVLPVLAGGVALLSLPFGVAWLLNRREWWPLIPAWIFLVLALLLLVIWLTPPYEQVLPMIILAAVGLPFLAIYLSNHEHRWALIPAYMTLVLMMVVALTALNTPEEILGGIALIGLALPFWWMYMRDRSRWWALIPAGVLSGVALPVMFLASQRLGGREEYILFNGLLAIFLVVVWVTNRKLDWALWIAGGLVAAIVLVFWVPDLRESWPVVLLAVGAYILYRQVFARQRNRLIRPPKVLSIKRPPTEQPPVESPAVERPPGRTEPRPPEGVTFVPLRTSQDEEPKE